MALSGTDGVVRVQVRDNDPGVDMKDQMLIFDKFRQAGDTLTAKPPGTGLEVHISRQIIEHFAKRMRVQSRTGRGARFSFTLPVARVPATLQTA